MKNGNVDLSSAFVMHFRDVPPKLNKKALTVVAYRTNDGMVMGIAACSDKDQFSRRMGRTIAANRALKLIGESSLEIKDKPSTKEARQAVYETAHDVVNRLPLRDPWDTGVHGSTAFILPSGEIVVTPL
jgi:hypothetical protein